MDSRNALNGPFTIPPEKVVHCAALDRWERPCAGTEEGRRGGARLVADTGRPLADSGRALAWLVKYGLSERFDAAEAGLRHDG
jgi:hypothetical protein